MRSAGGTNCWPPSFVSFVATSRMELFAVPSFQEGSGSAAWAPRARISPRTASVENVASFDGFMELRLSLGPRHRELDWLLIAQDGHSQLVTGLDGLERFDDLGQVGVRRDGHALDREHDVAADDDLLALDDPDAIASAESEAGSAGILHHLLDQESTLLRHLEGFGHRARDEHDIEPVPPALALDQQFRHGVRGDDEPEPFAAP